MIILLGDDLLCVKLPDSLAENIKSVLRTFEWGGLVFYVTKIWKNEKEEKSIPVFAFCILMHIAVSF